MALITYVSLSAALLLKVPTDRLFSQTSDLFPAPFVCLIFGIKIEKRTGAFDCCDIKIDMD